MSRAMRERMLLALLLACALLAWGTAALAAGQGRRTETGYAAVQLAAAMGMVYAILSLVFTKQMVGFFQLTDVEAHAAAMS